MFINIFTLRWPFLRQQSCHYLSHSLCEFLLPSYHRHRVSIIIKMVFRFLLFCSTSDCSHRLYFKLTPCDYILLNNNFNKHSIFLSEVDRGGRSATGHLTTYRTKRGRLPFHAGFLQGRGTYPVGPAHPAAVAAARLYHKSLSLDITLQ